MQNALDSHDMKPNENDTKEYQNQSSYMFLDSMLQCTKDRLRFGLLRYLKN